jgi:hypothetical protein
MASRRDRFLPPIDVHTRSIWLESAFNWSPRSNDGDPMGLVPTGERGAFEQRFSAHLFLEADYRPCSTLAIASGHVLSIRSARLVCSGIESGPVGPMPPFPVFPSSAPIPSHPIARSQHSCMHEALPLPLLLPLSPSLPLIISPLSNVTRPPIPILAPGFIAVWLASSTGHYYRSTLWRRCVPSFRGPGE